MELEIVILLNVYYEMVTPFLIFGKVENLDRETRKNELEQKILNHELLTEEEINDYR